MAIEGPLRELGIHDVFQLLDLSRKTGVLRVASELRNNAGTIYFEDGAIVYADIRSNPHPLGSLLLRTGRVNEATGDASARSSSSWASLPRASCSAKCASRSKKWSSK
jgi:hypothetical protein